MEENKWQHLSDKRIISLLVGSTPVKPRNSEVPEQSEINRYIDIRMPRLSVEQIRKLSKKLGIEDKFEIDASRKLSQLIEACYGDEQKIKEIIEYIFSKENFINLYNKDQFINSIKEADEVKSEICQKVVNKINENLHPYDCKLVFEDDIPYMTDIKKNGSDKSILNISDLANISEFQISEAYKKINGDINKGDKTGAITQSRTILEGALKYAISKQDKELLKPDKLPDLCKSFEKLYLNNEKISNSRLKDNLRQLCGNLSGAVQAIGSIRNQFGDAHAVNDTTELTEEKIHFVVNASFSLFIFILETCKLQER